VANILQRLKRAFKELAFPQNGYATVPMFSSMANWQNAITHAIEGNGVDPANSSLVFSGIRWLGSRLPEAEIEVREPDEGSDSEDDTVAVPDHPLVSLWNWANPYDSGAINLQGFAYSWILSGNAYFIIFRNASGVPVQLWYEPHWNVTPRWVNDSQGSYLPFSETQSTWIHPDNKRDDPKRFINYYEINRGNYSARLEVQDVIHFKNGKDPLCPRLGLSGLSTMLREITGDSAVADYYTGLLGSGGVPPYFVSIDKDLEANPEDVQKVKDGLRRLKAGEAGVIVGATIEKLGFTPQEMDHRVARYFSEERFAAVTGIPVECLNLGAAGQHSTYNNVTEANRQATQEVLVPLWGLIADTLSMTLLRELDQDESRYVDFDRTHVAALQENENEKATRIAMLYEAGILTRGQAKTALNYPEDEKLDNVYFVKPGASTITADAPPPEPIDPVEEQKLLTEGRISQEAELMQ
jgi:HK97 family phage portal protein